MAERLLEMQGRFERGYPDIPLDAEMVEALKADDPNPMFVTIPIAKVGAISRNGRTYNREAVQAIVQQVNEKHVVGEAGHMRDEDRPYRWDASPIRWLGAALEESSNTAWGKFYVLPSFPQIRDHLRVALRTNAEIGTSIYGTAQVDENGTVGASITIESIDLAHPDRLGLPELAAKPQVTAEMQAPDSTPIPMKEQTMPEESAVISELRQKNDQQASRIQELERIEEAHRQLERDMSTLRKKLGIAEAADPIRAIHLLQTTAQDLSTRVSELTGYAIDRHVSKRVDVEAARPLIQETLAMQLTIEGHKTPSEEVIASVLESVLARPTMKAHIAAEAEKAIGAKMTPPSHKSNALSDTPVVESFFTTESIKEA